MKIRVYDEHISFLWISEIEDQIFIKPREFYSLILTRYIFDINFPIIFKKIYHSIFNKIPFLCFFHPRSKDKSFLKKKYHSLELRITSIRKNIAHPVELMMGVFIRRNRDETYGCRPRSRQGNLDRDKKRKRKILQRVSPLPGASSIGHRKAASFTWI